jgi:hypothetical protein
VPGLRSVRLAIAFIEPLSTRPKISRCEVSPVLISSRALAQPGTCSCCPAGGAENRRGQADTDPQRIMSPSSACLSAGLRSKRPTAALQVLDGQ